MIFVDERAGSKELYAPLLKAGLQPVMTRLEFGDLSFQGRGPERRAVDVGIEYKKLPELIQSIRDGRFAGHQLPGMVKMYDYAYLLIEGEWRTGPQGQLLQKSRHGWTPRPGGMAVSEYEKHLFTFDHCAGVRVRGVANRGQAVQFIGHLMHWFTDKEWHQHTSHLAIHDPKPLFETSRFRQAVQKLPHIGTQASLALERHFHGSLRRVGNASVEELAGITIRTDGKVQRRLGTIWAKDIVAFCHNGQWP